MEQQSRGTATVVHGVQTVQASIPTTLFDIGMNITSKRHAMEIEHNSVVATGMVRQYG